MTEQSAPTWPGCPCPRLEPEDEGHREEGPAPTRTCLCGHIVSIHNEDGTCGGGLDPRAPGMMDRAIMAAMNAGGSYALFDLLRATGWRDPVEYKADIAQVVREIVGLALDHEDSEQYIEWVTLIRNVADGVYGKD